LAVQSYGKHAMPVFMKQSHIYKTKILHTKKLKGIG